MFADTSAIVAILVGEPDADRFVEKIEGARTIVTGAHVRLEAVMNLSRILGLDVVYAEDLYAGFLSAAKIDVLPITDDVAIRAVDAFRRYGKGRGHPAALNFGDCLSYACAASLGLPILFKGRDFPHTDLPIA